LNPVRRRPPRLLTAAALVAAALVYPAGAAAHGLIQRADLPIPEWLFGWAAAIVLVVSFAALAVLWPKPRLEEISWRPLPGGRAIASRPVEILFGALGVFLFGMILWAGFFGTETALDNFAPTFVLIIVWVGFVFASLLLGDVFRAVNPWRAIGRVAGRLFNRDGRRRLAEYPESWGRWPAAIGLLLFTWIELASGWGEHPRKLAMAIVVYSLVQFAGMARFGVETWTSRGEAFGVYFNLFARVSVFETRDRVLGTRPLLGGLPSLERLPGTTALVAVMIGTVTYDGLSQGRLWKNNIGKWVTDGATELGFGIQEANRIAATVGVLLGVLLVAGFYRLGIEGARTVGGGMSGRELRRGFVHSLVPIAMVYAMAHYMTFLVFQGQSIKYLASDPLGHGWDIFGTAKDSGIDYSLLSQNATWYLQVGFVVAGHVAALVLAHDRALVLYGQAKQAVRSQYWMLGIMVGFTTLALWLLAQANA
jgi:hypothetical protein